MTVRMHNIDGKHSKTMLSMQLCLYVSAVTSMNSGSLTRGVGKTTDHF